ncbi:hypothetical protein FOA52_001964 [Chlamydomonas sp. UWO 241]|nr:hypothetical protein FOA52_001964 [Chlamydomonas sp. UWO 241]
MLAPPSYLSWSSVRRGGAPSRQKTPGVAWSPFVDTRRSLACWASASTPTTKQGSVVLGLSRQSDVAEVALLVGLSFGYGNFPGIESEGIEELEQKYAVAVEKEVTTKLREALERKAEARKLHREYRLTREAARLRAQLAVARGERASFPRPESPQDLVAICPLIATSGHPLSADALMQISGTRSPFSLCNHLEWNGMELAERAVQKWVRARTFCCVVARDGGSRELLGCVSLSLMQAEAFLPPPFPSTAPLRLYVSNMSVSTTHRRRGAATRLLRQCERIGRLWGHTSLWLHVGVRNTAAQGLYEAAGFTVVNRGFPFAGPLGQILMSKTLAPLGARSPRRRAASPSPSPPPSDQWASNSSSNLGLAAAASSADGDSYDVDSEVDGGGGRTRAEDGVFLWGGAAAAAVAALAASSLGGPLGAAVDGSHSSSLEDESADPGEGQQGHAHAGGGGAALLAPVADEGVAAGVARDEWSGGEGKAAGGRGGDAGAEWAGSSDDGAAVAEENHVDDHAGEGHGNGCVGDRDGGSGHLAGEDGGDSDSWGVDGGGGGDDGGGGGD